MNTNRILGMLYEMQRDLNGMGRPFLEEDEHIKNFLMRLYNNTDVDWEEVKDLWMEYLTEGKLSVADAIQKARQRIAKAAIKPSTYYLINTYTGEVADVIAYTFTEAKRKATSELGWSAADVAERLC